MSIQNLPIEDIYKMADVFLIAEKELLESYSYITGEEYKTFRDNVLNILYTKEQIEEYNEFLKAEGIDLRIEVK